MKLAANEDDMQELRRRILFMLHDDDNGNGQYSVGLKAALWELEHIDKPFVHGK
ncbi:hypothetical protein [Lentilactobacillus buchneri]|uniref:hypothetical protein n=1 Tax=Lentilactobacillus buchneri TaxID=1581 RepID=UPI0002075F24|nr:hypothetical protein [Lentilactobacillus buchneri]AEB73681.1 hypothetical protein Lbuc_1427 [Lentilactobacillus buchneri NRRL B-30929]